MEQGSEEEEGGTADRSIVSHLALSEQVRQTSVLPWTQVRSICSKDILLSAQVVGDARTAYLLPLLDPGGLDFGKKAPSYRSCFIDRSQRILTKDLYSLDAGVADRG